MYIKYTVTVFSCPKLSLNDVCCFRPAMCFTHPVFRINIRLVGASEFLLLQFLMTDGPKVNHNTVVLLHPYQVVQIVFKYDQL
jgi:hypothetical protein